MTKLNLAIWYLNLMLFDGPCPAREIVTTGTKLGFTEKTLERAKKALGVTSIKTPIFGEHGKWLWKK